MDDRRFTSKEKSDCAKREVSHRRRVYAGLVERGKMSREEADRQIAMMQEIADDYLRVAQGREPELPL